jgi:single-strand DNA-binding protein
MNVISIVGRLCEAPELKQSTSGKSVMSVTVAVDRPFAKDVTDFIPIVVWNQTAEYLSKYAHKGSKVAITGKLTTRKWEDKNGNKRTAFEVLADTAEICESKVSSTESNPQNIPSAYTGNSQNFEEIPQDETLPF